MQEHVYKLKHAFVETLLTLKYFKFRAGKKEFLKDSNSLQIALMISNVNYKLQN
jgi:hypothetical protein